MASSEYISPIATVAAVIVGFILSQISEQIKSGQKSRKESVSIKKLIELEISKNSVALHGYLNGILKDDNCEEKGEFSAYTFGKRVEVAPFPTLSLDVWKSQLAKLPNIYTTTELSGLWNYFQAIEEIWLLHEHICEAHNQASVSASRSSVSGNHFAYGLAFNNRAKDAANLLYQNIRFVIDYNA